MAVPPPLPSFSEASTGEQTLRRHLRFVGASFIFLAVFLTLVMIGISQANQEKKFLLIAVCFAVPLIVASIGILSRARWGRVMGLVVGVAVLIWFPIGTGVGIYAIVMLNRARHLFRSETGGGFSLSIQGEQPDGRPVNELPFEVLRGRSLHELEFAMGTHNNVWNIEQAAWNADQAAGTLTFVLQDGRKGIAPMQIIGTFNPKDSTWLWAWDHPSILPRLMEHSQVVRAYGLKHGVDALTARKITCTEEQAWEFAAIARALNNAAGAWRGPTDGPTVFMTFGNMTFSKP